MFLVTTRLSSLGGRSGGSTPTLFNDLPSDTDLLAVGCGIRLLFGLFCCDTETGKQKVTSTISDASISAFLCNELTSSVDTHSPPGPLASKLRAVRSRLSVRQGSLEAPAAEGRDPAAVEGWRGTPGSSKLIVTGLGDNHEAGVAMGTLIGGGRWNFVGIGGLGRRRRGRLLVTLTARNQHPKRRLARTRRKIVRAGASHFRGWRSSTDSLGLVPVGQKFEKVFIFDNILFIEHIYCILF